VFLINEDGEKVGEVSTQEALARANELELDLVEVAPNAKPPVCKILLWSKFKYEQEKKAKEMKKKGKQKKDKSMQFPATADVGDKEHKMKRVAEFLEKGHRVKVLVFIKGRLPFEKAETLMKELVAHFGEEYKTLEDRPMRQGRSLIVTFLPK
jgi:translation initiation factor IF-3